ncbi:MAG: YeeE/YedE family protein [Epsilonproteobacteria bacterium]|nr:YeeE/YedE family protein [Campylobacterota bacterium]
MKLPRTLGWIPAGLLLSLLIWFTFSTYGANRPIGASTGIAYMGAWFFGLTDTEYYRLIQTSGSWEVIFLIGVLFGGAFTSIFITKTFRFRLLPPLWKKYKNRSVLSRLFWSFIGGFLVVFGARTAGGCTSGHFLSGASQTAVSGLIFGGVAIVVLIVTGRLFYHLKKDGQ